MSTISKKILKEAARKAKEKAAEEYKSKLFERAAKEYRDISDNINTFKKKGIKNNSQLYDYQLKNKPKPKTLDDRIAGWKKNLEEYEQANPLSTPNIESTSIVEPIAESDAKMNGTLSSTIFENIKDQYSKLKTDIGEFKEANPETYNQIRKAGIGAGIGAGVGFLQGAMSDNGSAIDSALLGGAIGGVGAGIHQRVRTTRIKENVYTKKMTASDEKIVKLKSNLAKEKGFFNRSGIKGQIRDEEKAIKANQKLENSPEISAWKWGAAGAAGVYASNVLDSNSPINPSPM